MRGRLSRWGISPRDGRGNLQLGHSYTAPSGRAQCARLEGGIADGIRRWVATSESSFGHPRPIRESLVGAVLGVGGPTNGLVLFVWVACRYAIVANRYDISDEGLRVSWCPT